MKEFPQVMKTKFRRYLDVNNMRADKRCRHSKVLLSQNWLNNCCAQEGCFHQDVEFRQHLQKSEVTQIHLMGCPGCFSSLYQKVNGAS